jgi:hypothetical protein
MGEALKADDALSLESFWKGGRSLYRGADRVGLVAFSS